MTSCISAPVGVRLEHSLDSGVVASLSQQFQSHGGLAFPFGSVEGGEDSQLGRNVEC